MKHLSLSLLFGLISAAHVYDDNLDNHYKDIISQKNFVLLSKAEKDMKTELGKRLKQTSDRENFISSELPDQSKDVLFKTKNEGVQLKERSRNLLEDVKDRVQSRSKQVPKNLKITSIIGGIENLDVLQVREKMKDLLIMIDDDVDTETIKQFIMNVIPPKFSQLRHILMNLLDKGPENLKSFIKKNFDI